MSTRKLAILACLAASALLISTGCVSKKAYRTEVEQTASRIDSVESGVEANQKRIDDLSSETDSKIAAVQREAQGAAEVGTKAMRRADEAAGMADSAAKGKLLWSLKLSDDRVKFDFGKDAVGGEAAAAMDDLIRKVKGLNRAVYLEIEGHTDNVGAEELNMELGHRRAMAVRNYLNEKGGIPLHAMNTISYGESRPEADNSTREGRAQNRRVVIKVLE
jgi:outer membrane protein OmpA-like peptidoglycan-associated protein